MSSDVEEEDSLLTMVNKILGGGLDSVSDASAVESTLKEESRKSNSKRTVSAVPSANNSLTFYVDEEEAGKVLSSDEDTIPEDPESRASPALDEEEPEEDPVTRDRELTEKYLAGEMTFKEFVSSMNVGEDEVSSENEDSDVDEEWIPPGKRTRQKNRAEPRQRKGVEEEDPGSDDEFSAKGQKAQQKSRGCVGRKKKLDPALQGLMGEAHLRFARGDVENGKKMCLEIIRQDPSAPEPFQALANLYEEGDDIEKGLQFALLAAQLAPPDPDEWSRLADMSLEQGDVKQACFCYKKAIEADPANSKLYFTRCHLLEQIGDKKSALRCYRKLLQNMKEDQGAEFLEGSMAAARLLHEQDKLYAAQEHFDEAFTRFPSLISDFDIDLFLELLLMQENYQHALEICCQHCGVQFSCDASDQNIGSLDPEQQLKAFTALVVPDTLAAEVKCKLLITLINLSAMHLTNTLLDSFVEASPEDFGDMLLDISEALLKNKQYEKGILFFEKLVNSESYSQAAVWLQFGECLELAGRLEDAEEAFKQVVSLAPNHYKARLQLSVIMRTLGRPEDALLALAQDETGEMLNPHLLFNRCQLLREENKEEEFISKAKLLFSRHFVNIRNKEELHAVSSAKRISSKNKALNEVRNFRREPLDETKAAEFEPSSGDVSVVEEFDLLKKVCDLLFEKERYEELQRLAFSALGSPVFARNQEILKECEFLCLLGSFFNGDSYHAYNSVRDLVVRDVKNSAVWNMFNLVIMRADDVRHNRFLMRLMSRNPENLALGILNGHNCLVAGTYKYSLGEYMSAFKQDSTNPLIALMLGLTFCHMACQKFSAKKHSLVVQACAFFNTYKELRGDCQEVYYNLGRAMHQLSLMPPALFYYKKALELGPSVADDPIFDLKCEIAYNISLIYQASNNYDLARLYARKYIIV